MNVERMKELLAAGQVGEVEAAWVQAAEAGAAPEELSVVLEAMVAAGQLDTAEALGWALLEQRGQEGWPAPDLLETARRIVAAVPDSDQLRAQAAELYRQAHAGHAQWETMLRASGLLSGQSPRRAFRTLDTCLALTEGTYLVNRFDQQAMCVRRYNDALGEYELEDARGAVTRLEPKKLADEFEPAEAGDFRVMCAFHPEPLRQLLEADPASVLIGLCQAAGGQIDSVSLKDRLVGVYLDPAAWTGWWNKARTAAKRSDKLTIEGRNPVIIRYHPGGRTLEEEFDEALTGATMPLERLAVLQQYLRETQTRRLPVQAAFVQPAVAALARQAIDLTVRRPADALAAALALDALRAAGLPAPEEPYPSPARILVQADEPAEAVLELNDPSLWPAALDALQRRDDAAAHLSLLLRRAQAGQLDDIARRLRDMGQEAVIANAVADAAGDPLEHLEVTLWLWKGPQPPPANAPGKVELLGRMLNALRELDHDDLVEPAVRKEIRQQVRSALSANDYAAYKQALSEMSEGVAGTIRRLIERTDSLAQAVRDEMMKGLREHFYVLFVEKKVEPWLDERTLWTTREAMQRRQDELKHLIDVKMLENARAIGAAAEHGDLRENSEWQFAIEERDLLRARAAKMQDELSRARVITPESVPTGAVGIGSRVRVRRLSDDRTEELIFLGPWDSDIDRHIYSYQTVLGQSLMGKSPGETVMLKLSGEEELYRIEAVESAVQS